MTLGPRDLRAYLARLGVRPGPDGPVAATAATLRLLHERHLRRVPFENLDVIARRRLSYDLRDLFDKIVVRRRGGWCLETNWLLGHVLTGLGFPVEFIGAGVANRGGFKHDLSHLLLLVRAGNTAHLADVGFGGGGYAEPLPARPGVHEQATGSYLVEADGDRLIVARQNGGAWQAMYRCAPLRPRHITDFAATSDFHELSAESPFNTAPHCTRLTPEGWAVVSGDRLELRSDRTRAYALTDPALRAAVLAWVLHDAPRPPLGREEHSTIERARESHAGSQ
ncbi:arylamine N-acetyltransferase family protein [Sphaerisporangium corydalis]|uniref:Arylamine N-acetyltransferase n=1 Tax=Sphaerisporangium corydalis TaxID=1441875 RepID=A0ABV9E6D1_9ACTN|nr:arylamine N-acetyltransferase [Sphaerisporangium corydalis]